MSSRPNPLESHLDKIANAPKDNGSVKMIVIRPKSNERKILESCFFSFNKGVEGDNWAEGCWKSLSDGSPHPDVQVAITNSRVLEALASTEEKQAMAGDNLYVDFDLSEENLTPGDKLSIGEAILKITDTPHNGCKKFKDRFGAAALTCINSSEGKKMHLRGIYARIIKDGVIRKGDTVRKFETP